MFHYIVGERKKIWSAEYIVTMDRGVQAFYIGEKTTGDFFLYPYHDENRKTFVYYAFDTGDQKSFFENVIKIQGIGPKTAFHIAQLPHDKLQLAIANLDTAFFQHIPGVGPKSAKKILLALKDSVSLDDIQTMDIDAKLKKNILTSLKSLGYDTDKVKKLLPSYPEKITQDNLSDVIKWVIGQM